VRRSLRRLLLAAVALSLLGGCGLFREPTPDPVTAAIDRCDLGTSPDAAFRTASRALIDGARAGTVPVVDQRLLVGYRDVRADRSGPADVRSAEARLAVRRAHGLRTVRRLGPDLELVRATGDPWAAAERMLDDHRVRFAHPNVRLAPLALPDDPSLPQQWNLLGFGAAEAWDVEVGAARVTVAVIDSGLDPDHPDLAGRLEPGWDFYDGDADPSSDDLHGTHVTGIVGANGGDGVGVAGVAPSAVRLLPIKVFDDAGRDGQGRSIEAVVAALRWAAGYPVEGPEPRATPVDVANLSLGTAGSYEVVPALEAAVRDARRRGVLVIASAGNEGSARGVTSPANGPCAVAVGSVDEDLARSWFSNYDADAPAVDLVAPGGLSLQRLAVLSTAPGGGYARLSGTSMAAPFVSGVAALLASDDPALDAEALLERLLRSAYRPPGGDPLQLGFGIACPDAALGTGTACGRP
jgi:serine protease